MSDSNQTWGAAEQIEEMLLDRTFDGVVRTVQSRHGDAPASFIEDAVSAVVARLVLNNHGPKADIFFYVVAAADLEVRSIYRHASRHPQVPLDLDDPRHDHAARADDEPDELLLSGESGRVALEYLLTLLRRWDNERMALVTELHLRAALAGDPLSPEEAAEIASGVLDEEIRPQTTSVWKHRGLARLARELDPDDPFVPHTAAKEDPR